MMHNLEEKKERQIETNGRKTLWLNSLKLCFAFKVFSSFAYLFFSFKFVKNLSMCLCYITAHDVSDTHLVCLLL